MKVSSSATPVAKNKNGFGVFNSFDVEGKINFFIPAKRSGNYYDEVGQNRL